jgi:hypothetical protein
MVLELWDLKGVIFGRKRGIFLFSSGLSEVVEREVVMAVWVGVG